MAISRQKEVWNRDYMSYSYWMIQGFFISYFNHSAQYHRQLCTLHAFDQFWHCICTTPMTKSDPAAIRTQYLWISRPHRNEWTIGGPAVIYTGLAAKGWNTSQANATRTTDIVSMLGQRRRRWSDNEKTLDLCLVFALCRPAKTGLWPFVGSMLANRLRRWPNIEPTQGQCPGFAVCGWVSLFAWD